MTCKLGALLEPGVLTLEDAGTLNAALDELVPAPALAKALTLEGHKIGPTTVKDHRGNRCACARAAS